MTPFQEVMSHQLVARPETYYAGERDEYSVLTISCKAGGCPYDSEVTEIDPREFSAKQQQHLFDFANSKWPDGIMLGES